MLKYDCQFYLIYYEKYNKFYHCSFAEIVGRPKHWLIHHWLGGHVLKALRHLMLGRTAN